MSTLKMTEHPAHRIASILAVSALALGLSACGKTEEPTLGQRLDSAVEKTEQAAAAARAKAEGAMQGAESKLEQGAAKMEASAKQALDTAMDAVDDATITAQVEAEKIAKTAMICVGRVFADTELTAVSKLYDSSFSHGSREAASD